MTLEQLNTALYEKIYAEQQEFISSLKTMTPENIIQYAYELVKLARVRADRDSR